MSRKRFNIILEKIKDKKDVIGAEIGVNKGITSDFLLKNKIDLKLIAIDPYILEGFDEYYPSNSGGRQHTFKHQQDFDLLYEETKSLLDKYGDRIMFIRDTSVNASKLVDDDSLDFVFIDANHIYEHVRTDILLWSKKVKFGGYIMGHDYNKNDIDAQNICRAVDELFNSNELNLDSDHCWYVIKTRELEGE